MLLAWAGRAGRRAVRVRRQRPRRVGLLQSFTQAAYRHIGLTLPRTAGAQRDWLAAGHGTRIPPGQERPGDLIFWDSYLGPNAIGHVVIVRDPTTRTTFEAKNPRAGVGSFSYAGVQQARASTRSGAPAAARRPMTPHTRP